MYTKTLSALAFLLILAGLLIPLWYIAVAGLVLLAVMLPIAGVFAGFGLDIIYGAPSMLPVFLSFPCLLAACLIGLGSLFLRTYIRS
jgi:hypothetical protein